MFLKPSITEKKITRIRALCRWQRDEGNQPSCWGTTNHQLTRPKNTIISHYETKKTTEERGLI